MKEHLKEILEYSHKINNKLIERFNDGDLHLAIPGNAIKLLSHILNAQSIWNSRIKKENLKTDVWKIHAKEEMRDLENTNFEESLSILEDISLDSQISYSNTRGEKFQNSLKDILFHLVNHSTYHRGQIAAELRKSGLEPIASDYIIYKREMQP